VKVWLKIVLWILLSSGVIVVLYFENIKEQELLVSPPNIRISVDGPDAFLTEKELLKRLKDKRLLYDKQVISELNLNQIETLIKKMPEVKKVQVYKKIGNSWNIDLELIKPIARIFNKKGVTYYLDSDGKKMQRSDLHTARVLVFSGEIMDEMNSETVQMIINNESLKSIRVIDDIYRISNYVCNDPFLQSLIGQVYYNENHDFILIPVLGDHKIVFGKANSKKQVREKFQKLKVFYKEAIPYEGWEKYSEISLKYEGQIVCRKSS